MKKVIVTGATGMIASEMIRQMVADGIEILAIIRPGSRKIKHLPENDLIKIVECDSHRLADLKGKLSTRYDTFYHFAWDGVYGNSRNDMLRQEQNVHDTLVAVELAHACGCQVFVGAGSQAEFGHVQGMLSDAIPKNPITGYGVAKYAAGRLSGLMCEQFGMRQSWGRVLSAYGPGDNSYTMIMSSIVGMLEGKRLSFTKGEQIWDYIYSEDCSRAFYLIGLYGEHRKSYTIGSGNARPLKEYIIEMRDLINPKLEIGLGEREYFENQTMELRADIQELTEDTGFVPKVDFREGLRKTIDWVKGKSI